MLDDRHAVETGHFLDRGPALTDAEAQAGPGPADGAAGTSIGPYRLIRELGRGGMSVVYLAERDDQQLRRQVALKLPHAGPGQDALASRLLRERDLLVGLEHPHIARLYDVVLTPQGLPCLVLEYIEGEPIDVHCARQALDVAARLRLFDQAVRAVQFAHSRLVLHRDLKPSNILVDVNGTVKLLDFGIAKVLDTQGEGRATALTRLGGSPMTPDYAAPEQVAGQPLGTGCDVYALGVVLYELLTGERPYRLPRGTRGELEEAILAAEPVRPSERWRHRADADAAAFGASPLSLRRQLAGDLDIIVLHALRKQPAQRYASAEALALDLHRWANHEPIAAHADSRIYRLQRFVQRHRLTVVSGALVCASLMGGLGAVLWQAGLARAEARKAEAIKTFLVGLFEAGSLNQDDAARKSRQTIGELLERSALALHHGFDQQPALRSELQGVVGRMLSDLALNRSALALRQARVDQLLAADAPPQALGEALRDLAETHEHLGHAEAARAALDRVVDLLRHDPGREAQIQRWAAEATLAHMDLFSGREQDALKHIEPASMALDQLVPDSVLAAQAWSTLAQLRREDNRMDEALALQRKALAIVTRVYAGQGARLARERFRHAMVLWQPLGDLAGAEPELRQAWTEMRQAAGDDHVETALIEEQLGLVQLYRGDETGAATALAHARSVLEKHASSINPDLLVAARLHLVESHLQAGRFSDAAPLLASAREALAAQPAGGSLEWLRYADYQEAELASQTGDDRRALERLAPWRERFAPAPAEAPNGDYIDLAIREISLHQAAGRSAQALQMLDELDRQVREPALRRGFRARRSSLLLDLGRAAEALPLAQAQFDEVQATPVAQRLMLDVVDASQRLARAWVGAGQAERALPLLQQALALYDRVGNERHLYRAALHSHYAQALAAAGREDAARRELAVAVAALRTEPRLGPAWWIAVRDTEALLARGPRAGAKL
ncbi:MAG: protein kinase [Burkholderiaceae bacterium]